MESVQYNHKTQRWEHPQPVKIAGRRLNLIMPGHKFRTTGEAIHSVARISGKPGEITIGIPQAEACIYGQPFQSFGAFFYEGQVAEWIPTPVKGTPAKALEWHWAGVIAGISPMGHFYVKVGNEETGQTYPVLRKDLIFEWKESPGKTVWVHATTGDLVTI